MATQDAFGLLNITASGLSAERLRMEVVANNIANAFTTRAPGGGPFRRQEVVFEAVLNERLRAAGGRAVRGLPQLGGVRVVDVVNDNSPFNRVYQPGHPDADAEGFVLLPNVNLPIEMVNLITASRAYEANLRVAQSFRQITEQSLAILRG
jgi:flagellar basal-body rod protein FlgC